MPKALRESATLPPAKPAPVRSRCGRPAHSRTPAGTPSSQPTSPVRALPARTNSSKAPFDVELGSKADGYMINKTYIKFWPAEYHAQSSIDAALQIRKSFMADGYSWKDIARMEMESFEAAVSLIGSEPEKG